MHIVRYIRLLLLFLIPCGYTFAQCPQPDFTIPDTVCISEPLTISNTSTGATRYEWNFCSSDLEDEPALETVTTLTTALTPTDITTVFDGTDWYGFVSSRDNNKIFRLYFGNSLSNTPTYTDIGNPGNLLSKPEQMKITKDGTNWIGIIVNLNNYLDDFSIVRFNFGNSLTNSPVASRITALDSYIATPRGIEIINDNGNYVVFIANTQSNVITMANFGNSLLNTLNSSNIKNIILPDAITGLNVMGISIIKDCDQWYGLAASFNNKIYKLSFGSTLFANPSITAITATESLMLSPVKVALKQEMGNTYAFIMHVNGKVVALNFGEDLENNTPVISNSFSMISDVVGMELIKDESDYYLFTVDFAANQIYRFDFANLCDANYSISTEQVPAAVFYNRSGPKKVELKAFSNTSVNGTVKTTFVRPQVMADFAIDKRCMGSVSTFTAANSSPGNWITAYTWDFGNGNIATGKIATFVFPADGIFPVKLTITDACGKMSEITKQVVVTKQNTADYIAPASSCSNETIKFEDVSTTAGDVINKWLWDFGDGQTATEQNPEHMFIEAGIFNVSLSITGASGCTQTVTKSISIIAGPSVDFMVENACLGSETSFVNLTAFSPNTNEVFREWRFGDNTTSAELNPVHTYPSTGNYTVTLTVRNNLNCTITKTKIITVRRKPETDFSYSIACSGEPVNFFDESSSSDGSIKNWAWEFGDTESGLNNYSTLQQASHIFKAPGTFKVKLKVETINGCIDSLTKNVIIIPSPQSIFSTKLNCNNKEISFIDQSAFDTTNPITNWYWDFGDNTTSTDQHPVHAYNHTGIYTVTLITTASSRCTNTYTKSITINEPPIADFIFPEKLCLNNPIQFTDKSTGIMDPITNWNWDFGRYGSSNEQHPQLSFTGAEIVPVKLTITTATGCNASIVKNITLQKAPEASFTYQAVSEQTPLSINFTSNTINAASITWSFGDGNSGNLPNEQHTYESGGIYPVVLTVINAAGCSTIVQQEITLSNISSNVELKLEAVSLEKSGNTTDLVIRLVNNSPHILSELELSTVINEKNTYNHTWQGELLPEKMLVYKYTLPITGDESNTIASVCVMAASKSYNKNSNRQCANVQNTFSVLNPFPNPANSEIYLPFLLPVKGEIQISIIDVLGRLQASYKFHREAGFHQLQIDKGRLAAGLYFIEYNIGGKQQIKSIIVN